MTRMDATARRRQVLDLAAAEFAEHGLQAASMEAVAQRAGITQAYVFRIFGTKKALFLEAVVESYDHLIISLSEAAGEATGSLAIERMAPEYLDQLTDRTRLQLQLQGLAACADPEIRARLRDCHARLWDAVATITGLDAVAVKGFLGYGLFMSAATALDLADLESPFSEAARTPIHGGLFDHMNHETNTAPAAAGAPADTERTTHGLH